MIVSYYFVVTETTNVDCDEFKVACDVSKFITTWDDTKLHGQDISHIY